MSAKDSTSPQTSALSNNGMRVFLDRIGLPKTLEELPPLRKVRKAYLESVRRAHPDKGGDAKSFCSLQQAWRSLKRHYDLQARLSSASIKYSNESRGENWENEIWDSSEILNNLPVTRGSYLLSLRKTRGLAHSYWQERFREMERFCAQKEVYAKYLSLAMENMFRGQFFWTLFMCNLVIGTDLSILTESYFREMRCISLLSLGNTPMALEDAKWMINRRPVCDRGHALTGICRSVMEIEA